MLPAVTIARPIWRRIQEGRSSLCVIGVHDRACNLESQDGDVLSLVLPTIGNGPCNIVVQASSGCFAALTLGTRASKVGGQLRLGMVMMVELATATVWEPRPDWGTIRTQKVSIRNQLAKLTRLAMRLAPLESLLERFLEPSPEMIGAGSIGDAIHKQVLEGARLLRAGWAGDGNFVRDGAKSVAGVGGGLTPAGDDFLIGIMLGAWLAHTEPTSFCQTLLQAAAPRTSKLSAAYIQAAARGECSEAWHELLHSLCHLPTAGLESSVRRVLSYGATSGADTLAGFLWAARVSGWATCPCNPPQGYSSCNAR